MSFDSRLILTESGGKEDAEINLFTLALAFAASSHEGISVDKYFSHAAKIAKDVGTRHKALLDAGADDDVAARLAALKHILHDREGYVGDSETYDDLQNADLMRVIDRRKGLPISLCILYINAGRMNGWQIDGLNFPGHFLARIEYKGTRLIFDPFTGCEVMEAPELRQLLKKVRGANAELSADYYKPCSNRDTLIRLENNVKLRLIDAEDYEGALEVIDMMRLFDPNEYRLLLDAGVLYAKTGQRKAASDVLEKYIVITPNPQDKRDAEAILRQIKDTVH
jgi:regulator of sirC expression with transglutaminase-like and TPR domain